MLTLSREGTDPSAAPPIGPVDGPRDLPHLCLLGPNLGRHPGWVTTQGEIVTDLLRRDGYTVASASSSLSPVGRLTDMLRCLWRGRRDIDVVVLSVFSGRALVTADVVSLAAHRLGLPQIHVLHGGRLPNETPARARRVLGRAARVVAPSEFLGRWARGLGIGERVQVVPNVVDLGEIDYRPRRALEPRLLWMRTFHETYHPELALETLARLRNGGVDAGLTMAGQDKGLLEPTRRRVQELDLAEHVAFPGFLGPAEKRRELSRHDLFLNTNRNDNTPVSVIEALAAGLPLVATRVGGVPDLVTDGENALLVPDDDAEAMAAAVGRLLDDPDLAESLSTAGRRRAEECAWGTVRVTWGDLFEALRRRRCP
ncbi:MAG: glycosyltransferase family 4 protein [Acidobacteriota bacterium]